MLNFVLCMYFTDIVTCYPFFVFLLKMCVCFGIGFYFIACESMQKEIVAVTQ